jgi:hypothetical protein
MGFVYRELTGQELERLKGLGLKNPWAKGPAMFGDWAAVDDDRDLIVVGLGGGNLEVPEYWALVSGDDALILVGGKEPRGDPNDPRLIVWVGAGMPADSPLWRIPDLYRVLKEGLFMEVTHRQAYSPGRIWFRGVLGDRLEAA